MALWLVVLIMLAIVLVAWLQGSARAHLLQELLAAQQRGNRQAYTALLATPVAKFFFNRVTRLIMKVNYELVWEDTSRLQTSIAQLVAQPVRNRDTVICLMKAYAFDLENGEQAAALALEPVLQSTANQFSEVRTELDVLHRIYIVHDPELEPILAQQLAEEQTPEAKMVLLYRLTRLTELLDEPLIEATYMNQLRQLARGQVQPLN
ncbi:hypothetical protein [Lacticaseibacillus daqingensis]|uniref:hypothetical protein n=1 Tax=Lacticaseibacillus daqingensis TaxID=2486014 RepID=UPI000F7B0021|nr:hypothetical protein [Lacticaseibacillus daqingensis]